MLLLLLSLFAYNMINCTKDIKEKFNESSLINEYHHNYQQVQAFIKDVKHKFPEDKPEKREGNKHKTKRERAFHDQIEYPPLIGQLRRKTQQTRFFPLIRSRPVFPDSITPFTTELNSRHLNWDQIFPNLTVHTKSNVLRLDNRPLKSEYTTPKVQSSKTLIRSRPNNLSSIKSHTIDLNRHIKWDEIFPNPTVATKSNIFRLDNRPLKSEYTTPKLQSSKTLINSRSILPNSIKSYTIESNRHIKWDEIFLNPTVVTKSKVFRLDNRPLKLEYTTPKLQSSKTLIKFRSIPPSSIKSYTIESNGQVKWDEIPYSKSKVFRLAIHPLVSESPTNHQPAKKLIRSRKIPKNQIYNLAIHPLVSKPSIRSHPAKKWSSQNVSPSTITSYIDWDQIFPSPGHTKSNVFRLRPITSESLSSPTLIWSRPIFLNPTTQLINRPYKWDEIFFPFSVHSKSNVFRLQNRPFTRQSLSSLMLIRSRPSFPNLTTQLISRHLKWGQNFTEPTITTKSNVIRLAMRPLIPGFQYPGPQPAKQPMINPKVRVNGLKQLNTKSEPLRTTSSWNYFLWNSPKIPLVRKRPSLTLENSTDEVMKYWLQEITAYTPIEHWMKTLTTESVMTTSEVNTTRPTPPIARTLSKPQSSVTNEKLQACSRGQRPHLRQQLISLLGRPIIEPEGKNSSVQVIEDKDGIHLRALKKNEDVKTTVVAGDRPNDVNILVSPGTAGVGVQRAQDPDVQTESSNKIKRIHSKTRKRKQHPNSYKRNRVGQSYRPSAYSSEDVWSKDQEVEYPIMGGMRETKESSSSAVTLSTENKQQRPLYSSNEMSQYYPDEPEDESRIKHTERRDEFQHRRAEKKTNKDIRFPYKQVKKRLKEVESQKKVKQLKLKENLLRRIVEGSSYSDEEASLKKNLKQALRHRKNLPA